MVLGDESERLRILYLPLFEPGYPVLEKQKRGLREALEKHGTVVEIDWCNEVYRIGREKVLQKISNATAELQPTLVIGQFHGANIFNKSDIEAVRKSAKDAIWVNWNGDYQDFRILRQEDIEIASAFDLHLMVAYDNMDEYNKRGIKSRYWQIGWEPYGVGYEPNWLTPQHQVLFMANCIPWYPMRRTMVETLRNSGFKLGLYGMRWPLFWARGNSYYDYKKGCRLIRAAKLVLADNPRPNASGYVSNRLFQSLVAGGAMVLMQYFKEYEALGFIDGEHFVIWQESSDLIDKIKYWLLPENEQRRGEISATGQKFCLENHSFDVRVRELLQMVSELG